MKSKLQIRRFALKWQQGINRNAILAIVLLGLIALSTLAAAPKWLQAGKKSVQGENPELHELSKALAYRPLQARLESGSSNYLVRIIYMIPSNRSPQRDSVAEIEDYVLRMRDWFAEEMARLGYGRKSFLFETKADGLTPNVNLAYVAQPDVYFQGDYLDRWGKILNSIIEAGFPTWKTGEVLLVIAETHIQRPDGLIEGAFVGGAGVDFTGVGAVTGDSLARFSNAFLTDNRTYNGLIIPEIGPYPMVQDVTFPWFEGTTLSSTSSSAQGAALHELSHGFQLWHDFRNDENFNGNLMGNGLRGVRGALYPTVYPKDDMRLASGSALQLNYSRFFNNGRIFTEDTPPQVIIQSHDIAVPIHGQCPIRFSASDADSQLAGALLIRDGHVVADMPLAGKSVNATISTYDYVPGELNEWLVQVFDTQGNTALSPVVKFACEAGRNQAPQPFIQISKRHLKVGEKIVLNAGLSSDPGGNPQLMTVEWDLEGDGVLDTSPSTEKTITTIYMKPGFFQIIAKLTDAFGDSSKSMPIGIRVDADLARSILQDVNTEMTALRGRIQDSHDRDELTQVLQKIAAALRATLWLDETHLQSASGVAVFYASRDAVNQLHFILRDQQNKSPKAQLPGFIQRIVSVQRVLANVALNNAINGNGDPLEINNAKKSLAQAEARAAAGRYEMAIDSFSLAWEQARDSLKSSCS